MREFEEILKKMRERGIIPRIHYELMAIRWLKIIGGVLICVGIIWLIVK
ncbi:hypothetical protein [Hungatella hathewayi]